MLASRVRVAACAGLLSAGLLVASSGGAVALADPDSTASTAHAPQGARESNQDNSPAARVTDTLRKAVQDIAGALDAGRKPARLPSATAAGPTTGTGHARTPGRRNAGLPTAAATDSERGCLHSHVGRSRSEHGSLGSEPGCVDLHRPGHLPGQPERDGHCGGGGGSHRRRAGLRRHQRRPGRRHLGDRFGRRRHVIPAKPPGPDGRRQPESSGRRGACRRRRAAVSGGRDGAGRASPVTESRDSAGPSRC